MSPNQRSAMSIRRRVLALVLTTAVLGFAVPRSGLAQEPTCVPPPGGLFAWWPLDEGAGAAGAADVVGGYDADYLGNPVAAQGMVAGAVRLDGDGDCLSAPDEGQWDFGVGEFTFEFWFSLDAAPSGSQGQPGDVLFAHSEGPTNIDKYIFALAPGQLEFISGRTSDGTGIFGPVTPYTPTVGEWSHIAVTRSGSDYSVWIDGQLMDTETNFANLPDASATLALGCVQEPWGGFLEGRLDEFSVYDRALTEQEIAAIFSAGAAGKCRSTSSTTTTTTSSTTTTTTLAPTTTTSTTLAPTTTTTSTTSTTLVPPVCGDADSSGKVTAADALRILKAAVGGSQCDETPCICNIDGKANVTAADALAALKMAVGQTVPTNCPC